MAAWTATSEGTLSLLAGNESVRLEVVNERAFLWAALPRGSRAPLWGTGGHMPRCRMYTHATVCIHMLPYVYTCYRMYIHMLYTCCRMCIHAAARTARARCASTSLAPRPAHHRVCYCCYC